MRFGGTLDLFLPPEHAKEAGILSRLLQFATGKEQRVRDQLEAVTFLHALSRVLRHVGVTNARALVVDRALVFHDPVGNPDDLSDMVLAFAEHVSVFGRDCEDLRLSVEHEEAGMRYELEARAVRSHREGDPSARFFVLGFPGDLHPQKDESAESYRRRVEPLVCDVHRVRGLELQFEAFFLRLADALSRAYPEGEVRTGMKRLGVETEVPTKPHAPPTREEPPKRMMESTASPTRNFSLSVEQRIAALAAGPPPYAVRLRKIEDMEAELVSALEKRGGESTVPIKVVQGLEALNKLIAQHNKYYPVESNLGLDPSTGELLDRGKPWRPLDTVSIDTLRARARGASG